MVFFLSVNIKICVPKERIALKPVRQYLTLHLTGYMLVKEINLLIEYVIGLLDWPIIAQIFINLLNILRSRYSRKYVSIMKYIDNMFC